MQTPVVAGFIIQPQEQQKKTMYLNHFRITGEAPFLGNNSSSLSRVGALPSATLVLVLRVRSPRCCKLLINYLFNIAGWQILITGRNCTGISWMMRYGTALVPTCSQFPFTVWLAETEEKPIIVVQSYPVMTSKTNKAWKEVLIIVGAFGECPKL